MMSAPLWETNRKQGRGGHQLWAYLLGNEGQRGRRQLLQRGTVSAFHNIRLSPVLVNPSSLECVTVDKSFSLSGPQFANE